MQDTADLSSQDRILADLEGSGGAVVGDEVELTSSTVQTSDINHVEIPMQMTLKPTSGDAVSSGSELEVAYLMFLRERLLKMAQYAGQNKECTSWLNVLKVVHWRLQRKEAFSSNPGDTSDLAALSSNGCASYTPPIETNNRACNETLWTVLFFCVFLSAFIYGMVIVSPYTSDLAVYSISVLALGFLASIVAMLCLLAPAVAMTLSCPLAMLFLFIQSLLIMYYTPSALGTAITLLSCSVLVGLWGVRTVKYLKLSLPLFTLSINIIKHHLLVIPICLVCSYFIALISHHLFGTIANQVSETTTFTDFPEAKYIVVKESIGVGRVIWICVLVFCWYWMCEFIRYTLQSILHGIIAFHYHLTPVSTHDTAHLSELESNENTNNSDNNNNNNNEDNSSVTTNAETLVEYLSQPTPQLQPAMTIHTPQNFTLALLLRILCQSFGSIVHGSLFSTPTRLVWILCRSVAKSSKQYRRRYPNSVFARIMRVILQTVEAAYSKWGKFSFRLVMIFGYTFPEASALTYVQFLEKGVDTLLSDTVVEGFVFLLGLCISSIASCLVISFLPTSVPKNPETPNFVVVSQGIALIITFCVFFAVFMCVSIVLDVVSTSVIAMYACFVECPAGLTKYDRYMATHLMSKLEFDQEEAPSE